MTIHDAAKLYNSIDIKRVKAREHIDIITAMTSDNGPLRNEEVTIDPYVLREIRDELRAYIKMLDREAEREI